MLVEGVPRVVCGVTDRTTCQEVVVALAQALGRPGRYTMREKYKECERSVTPNEHILESLGKHGQQVRDVQLTLLHNGPSLWEELSSANGSKYPPCAQMRKSVAGSRAPKDSGSLSLHRQSLPPLSRIRQQVEKQPEEIKQPKRKSLTLMEGARGWLGSLGRRTGMHQSGENKGINKDKRNSSSLEGSISAAIDPQQLSRAWGPKGQTSTVYQRASCCIGEQRRDTDSKHYEKRPEEDTRNGNAEELQKDNASKTEDEKIQLREAIKHQLAILQELQLKIMSTDSQIMELEEQQQSKQKAQQRITEEELEQIQFWENELKAEEVHEKDLQGQFLEMKERAVECKAKLEDYKQKMQGLHFPDVQKASPEQQESAPMIRGVTPSPSKQITTVPNEAPSQTRSNLSSDVSSGRKLPPREDSDLPSAAVPQSQTKERRPTGPKELREWWSRWTEAHCPKTDTKQTVVVHRSELTVHLGGTRV